MVAATIRTIFAQPDAGATRSQLRTVVGMLESRFPKAAELLEAAEADVTAYADFPPSPLAQDRVHQPAGAGAQEIKRRANVVGIFPDDAIYPTVILPNPTSAQSG